MVTERYTSSSTAALPRGHQGTPFESLRERLLAGLAVTERHDRATPLSIAEEASKRCGWNLCVIDDAAVARAAHDVLAELAPSQRERIDREYAAAVGGVPDGPAPDGPAKDAESAA